MHATVDLFLLDLAFTCSIIEEQRSKTDESQISRFAPNKPIDDPLVACTKMGTWSTGSANHDCRAYRRFEIPEHFSRGDQIFNRVRSAVAQGINDPGGQKCLQYLDRVQSFAICNTPFP